MFGSTGGFGGFGQTNQQSGTGTGSVFGSGGGFGASNTTGTGAFGSTTGAFGAPANTGGAFGTNTGTTSAFGGGGAFGSGTTGAFGASKPGFGAPATGGGIFGSNTNTTGTNAFGGGGGFGSNTATTSAFGGGNTTGGGLFGSAAKPATGGMFGSGTTGTSAFGSGFGSTANKDSAVPPAQGTATTPFAPHQEKEGTATAVSNFQTITLMPAYQNWSQEELRLIDYAQGRRYGNSTGQAGAFGFGTGFGSTNPGAGTTNTFGQANTGTTGGLFGANSNTTSAFNNNAGAFGQSNTTGTGLFGAQKPAATGGLFGSGSGTTNTGGGLFGSNTNTTSAFGSNTGTTSAFGSGTSGGLFGSNTNQQKPGGFSFGSASTTTPAAGAFGSTGTGFGANTGNTGGGLFGNTQQQQQQQQQQQPATGAFGSTTNTTTPFGGFGTNTQQQQQQNTGGAFGSAFGANNQQQQNKPAFGGFGSTAGTAAGGLFGNTQQQPQQQQSTGGLFGGNKPAFGAPATGTTGSGLFGSTQPQQQQQQPGGLFGSAATPSSGLFGQPNAAASTGATGGTLFGQAASKPLFGSSTAQPQTGNLFGGTNLGTQQPTLGGSLFGGNQQQQPLQQQQGGNLFGGSTLLGSSIQQQQPNFSTSISDSPYAGSQLLGGTNGQSLGPIATPLGASTTKKAAMIPHHKIAPKATSFTPRASVMYSRSASPFTGSVSSAPLSSSTLGRSFSSSNKLNLFDDNDQLLNAGAFTPGGTSRVASLKKLVIDKKLRDDNLFTGQADLKQKQPEHARSPSITKGILKKTVSFDMAGREGSISPGSTTPSRGEPSAEQLGYMRSPADRRRRADSDLSSPLSAAHLDDLTPTGKELTLVRDEDKVHGSYWMVPSANKLKSLSKEQQKRVIGLTVGRRGYGQVRFDHPVDITQLPVEIDEIPGNVVVFDVRICTVYPEHLEKPNPGKGLNVPATITLEDCFPVTKNERGKIRDPEHPRYLAHIRRLKSVKDTEFVDYLPEEGIWIFRVEHFTTYGLVDSDEEEEEMDAETTYEESAADITPRQMRQPFDDDSSIFNESMDADISGMDTTGDDTFDFKRRMMPRNRAPRGVDAFPGSFTTDEGTEDEVPYSDDEIVSGNASMEDQSFLGEGSVGSVEEEEEPAEPSDAEGTEEEDSALVIRDEEESGLFSPIEEESMEDEQPTPRAVRETPKPSVIANDWTEQLNNTISPVKRRFGGDNMFRPTASIGRPASRRSVAEKSDYNIFDLQDDLYGTSSVGPGALSPVKSRKRDAVESPVSDSDGVRPMYARPAAPTPSQNRISYYGAIPEDKKKDFNLGCRPVWKQDGTLVYQGQLEGTPRSFRRNLNGLQMGQVDVGEKSSDITDALEIQLRATHIKVGYQDVPVVQTDASLLFSSFADIPGSDDFEASIWRLAGILWDPVNDIPKGTPAGVYSYVEMKRRKELFTEFLQSLVEMDAEEHAQNAATLEEVAVAHLTANKVTEACAALLEAGDFRLATLVAQIGGDDAIRNRIKEQLENWRGKGVLSEITVPIRALYELVAGETCFSEGVRGPAEDTAPSFYFAERFNLDWRRVLGLKLWYGLQESDSLARAVEQFEMDVECHTDKLSTPAPPFSSKEGNINLLFGLLKLYSNVRLPLEEIFNIAPAGPNPLSPRVHWQLHAILSAREIRDFSSDHLTASLNSTFISYLETIGLWEWAIFVALHIPEQDLRVVTIKSILARNVIPCTPNSPTDTAINTKLSWLASNLAIPRPWINEARALRERAVGNHYAEAEHLFAAGAYDEAHRTISSFVAPTAIISSDLQPLKYILSLFTPEIQPLVKDWIKGGQVFLDYMKLLEMAGTNVNAGGKKAEEKRKVLVRFLGSLQSVEIRGFLMGVAVREMGGVVGKEVMKIDAEDAGAKRRVLQLPLTEDKALGMAVRLGVEYYKARVGA